MNDHENSTKLRSSRKYKKKEVPYEQEVDSFEWNDHGDTQQNFMKVDIAIKRVDNSSPSMPVTHRYPSRVEFKPITNDANKSTNLD